MARLPRPFPSRTEIHAVHCDPASILARRIVWQHFGRLSGAEHPDYQEIASIWQAWRQHVGRAQYRARHGEQQRSGPAPVFRPVPRARSCPPPGVVAVRLGTVISPKTSRTYHKSLSDSYGKKAIIVPQRRLWPCSSVACVFCWARRAVRRWPDLAALWGRLAQSAEGVSVWLLRLPPDGVVKAYLYRLLRSGAQGGLHVNPPRLGGRPSRPRLVVLAPADWRPVLRQGSAERWGEERSDLERALLQAARPPRSGFTQPDQYVRLVQWSRDATRRGRVFTTWGRLRSLPRDAEADSE